MPDGRAPDPRTPHLRGRPARWIPDAVVLVRAKDEAAAEALAEVLAELLSSHPERMRVLFEVGDGIADEERVAYGEQTKFVPVLR